MSWFQSTSLFAIIFSPLLLLTVVLCLPLLSFIFVLLYLSAWHTYYQLAQTDAEFNLPYDPRRVIKLNLLKLGIIVSWIEYMPKIVSFLYWRYWKYGPEQFDKLVSYDIPYHGNSKLDVFYPPQKEDGQVSKVILFIYGGGWGSGSKFLYMTLANTLRELGYIVVVPDYRKYPEVKIDEIYKDIRESIKWTVEHAKAMQGDPEQIYMMGHSAGAHLTAQVIFSDIIDKVQSNNESPSDPLPALAGLILMAGVYDISSHLIFETGRGVEKISAMARVMGSSEEGYRANSPIRFIEKHEDSFSSEELLKKWPRIMFLHGDIDGTVATTQSVDMFNTLKNAFPLEFLKQVDLRLRIHKNMGHGEPVTSLMLNIFSTPPEQKSLLNDIEEFINTPQHVEI